MVPYSRKFLLWWQAFVAYRSAFSGLRENVLPLILFETSQPPGVSVCWHCSRWAWNTHIITHAELFTQWGRKRDVELFTQWGRKRVGVGYPAPHCLRALFTWWGRKGDVELFTQWGKRRVGRVLGGVSSCSSHQANWLQLSSKTKLTSITVCQHSLS